MRVPSARLIGVVPMHGYQLAFHKQSNDGSGKCLLYTEQGKERLAFGAVYEFQPSEKHLLDAAEGKGHGYDEKLVQFPLNGETYTSYIYWAATTHIAPSLSPYHWYKKLVLAGARYHNLPDAYIASIEAVASIDDTNTKRVSENENLLKQMGWV